MIRQGIEDLGAREDVEADQQDIVRKQHRSREFIRETALVARDICEIANVLDLRVFHDELVHGDGCDPKQYAGENHRDDAWHPSQHGE